MSERLPVIFVSHGAPTLALDERSGADFAAWARELPRPEALLVVSAHWETRRPETGAEATLPLLHDFYGFPEPLYRLRYDAPPAPALLERVRELVPGCARRPERAWDHGVWVPLLHMFPRADVPLAQISLPRLLDGTDLVDLGRRLAPLREEGVLIVGSGGMVHNLGRLDLESNAPPEDWALDFDRWAAGKLLEHDEKALAAYEREGPRPHLAHPSAEHFRPLLVAVGAASTTRGPVHFPVEGFEYGNLSRRSVELG